MDDIYQYLLRVHKGLFKVYWVKYIDWDNGYIEYTKDKHEAGGFEPYERAVEIAHFLENEPGITEIEIIEW
ncbi:MAG: hypothetical protein E7177_04760 [Erysipelotrichaceae bacterium]|nr:hypothetical protein [Erysipelotrichaceae bacterium]